MGCCGGFIGSLWDSAVDTAEDVGGAIVGGLEDVGETVVNTIEQVADNPALLAAVAINIVAPGAGTAIGQAIGLSGTAATVVGNAAINTALNGGDVEAGIISAALPIVGGEIAGAAASQFSDLGLSDSLANTAGKITSQAALSAVTGKGDPLSILVSGGLSAGVDAITNEIPGYADLPQVAKQSIKSAVTASLSDRDPTQAAIDAAINSGLSALNRYSSKPNVSDISPLDVLGQPLTEEAKNIEPVYGLDPNLVAIGQGEQAAIDTAENVGNLEGLSSAEVGQGEQAAIDTGSNIGSLEGLSSAKVGESEQAAIDTIPQDQAIADLAATEGTLPVTEPTKTPGVSVGSGATTGTGTTTPTKTTTNSISTAPVAGGLASVGIPWLDTSADVLQGRSVGAPMNPFAGIDQDLAAVLRERGLLPQEAQQVKPTTLMASGGSTFGSELDDKLMPKFAPSEPEMLQTVASARRTPLALKSLRHLQQNISPLGNMGSLAEGGLPKKYQEAAPKGHMPEFVTGLTGYYADGRGTGQSDDIPAMLHDGDYVMDAETVSALGDGSSKAGRQVLDGFRQQVPHSAKSGGSVVPAKIADGEYVFPESFVTALGQGDNKRGASILDGLREKLREHKRSAPLNKIPPKAKSPLDYIEKAKG